MVIAMIAAAVLAVFPIGPTAALLAWPLYRAGVTAGWVYAVVGALSALVAPLVIFAIEIVNPEIIRLSDLSPFLLDTPMTIIEGCFALVGAFGGIMAVRVLR